MRPRNGSILRLGCTVYHTPASWTHVTRASLVTWVSEAIVADVFMSAIETITSKKRQLGDISAMFGVGIRRGTTLYRSSYYVAYIRFTLSETFSSMIRALFYLVYSEFIPDVFTRGIFGGETWRHQQIREDSYPFGDCEGSRTFSGGKWGAKCLFACVL